MLFSLASRSLPVALALCTAVCLSSPFSTQAAPSSARDKVSEDLPVKVTADNMVYNTDKNVVVFTGNVEAQRGEFRLWSAVLTIHLKPSSTTKPARTPAAPKASPDAPNTAGATNVPDAAKNEPSGTDAATSAEKSGGAPNLGTGDIDRIVAEKNVRFRYNTQNGTSDKATYTASDGVLLMEGNPVIRDAENSITGNAIRYFTNENRSEVIGGPKKRVEAVFSSNSQKKGQ